MAKVEQIGEIEKLLPKKYTVINMDDLDSVLNGTGSDGSPTIYNSSFTVEQKDLILEIVGNCVLGERFKKVKVKVK